jgi:two-component system, chemotaxis family, protein-glutamate methylesterase/glutaminase
MTETLSRPRPQRPYPATAPVIGMAASAGGLNALSQILSCMPFDFPASILIVQHTVPTSRSHLAELLARRTKLSVKQAVSGDHIEPGVVYIAPPDSHLTVYSQGAVALSQLTPVHFVRPSADPLFESLAMSFGRRAIAVVLTGMGHDSANGAQAVKLSGGTVLVQDESTSEFFGMPGAAIDAGLIENVLPLGQIAAALVLLGEETGA